MMQVQNQAQQSSEFEELTPLSSDEQDAIVGGIVPLLIVGAFTAARFAPAVIRATPAVVGGIKKYRDSSVHNTEGEWWSFL
jgi:hypothetical protein